MKNHAAAPQVALLGVFAADDFWRHVVRCADPLCEFGVRTHLRCESEIRQFDTGNFIARFLNQYVFRLDVAVDDVLAVAVGHGLEHLMHDECHLFRHHSFLFNYEVKQLGAMESLFDDVEIPRILITLMYFDQIRMVQLFQYFHVIDNLFAGAERQCRLPYHLNRALRVRLLVYAISALDEVRAHLLLLVYDIVRLDYIGVVGLGEHSVLLLQVLFDE